MMEKTDELTDLVKAQDDQMGTQTTELKESFSAQSKLLEQKLEELGSILNFVTLNLASDSLKEFGIQIQPPVGTIKSFASGQSPGVPQNQEDVKDLINAITLRIDSIIEVMKRNQQALHGDFKTLQLNLEEVNSSVLQTEERTAEELNKLVKSMNRQSVPASGMQEAVPNKYVENSQWWSKASTLTTAMCTVLTATVLVYEIFK